MKIGCIDYLNCFPFFYRMSVIDPVDGIDVIRARPADLNNMLRTGELALSPVSAAVYPELQQDVSLLPEFCLGSEGYVRSVVLYSRFPIEELDGRVVGLTSASETSVVLLKILLEKHFAVSPEYVPSGPLPDFEKLDAALVIGNEALYPLSEPVEYTYDIGDLWMRKTGHPVVFAVFAVRNDVLNSRKEKIKKINESFRKSLLMLEDNPGEVIEMAERAYPEIHYSVEKYFSLLRFEFKKSYREALMYFYREAASLGLLVQVDKILWAEDMGFEE